MERKIIDEILPLTAFLKNFERPGRIVRCRYFQCSQNYDAIIKVWGTEVEQGLIAEKYFIEITLAEEEHEYLTRESLAHYGFVFLGNNIKRIKKTKVIESKPVGQDADFPVKNTIKLIGKALEKKNQKVYPTHCILIIGVHPERPLILSEWFSVLEEVRPLVNRERFSATFVADWVTNKVFEI